MFLVLSAGAAALSVGPRLVARPAAGLGKAAPRFVRLRSAAAEEGEAGVPAVAPAAAAAAAPAAEAAGASVAASTINLVKSIVGAGVLALPAGVSAFADAKGAVWPAAGILTGLGLLSAYTFGVLGRVCGAYDAETYRDAWAKSVGEKSAWVVTACCTLTPFLACLSYSIIMGDAFASLIAAAGPGPGVTSALGALGGARHATISALAVGALWPLCSLKSLAALAPTSALGTAGVVYTAGFMAKRCLDGTYAAGGAFAEQLVASGARLPAFGSATGLGSPRLGVFMAMCGTAYMAHFNAPSFFKDAGRDAAKFSKVVRNGFGLSVLINVLVMAAGYLTFGGVSQGLILNNYANADGLAAVARLLFGVSVVFTFPLAYAAVKIGVKGTVARLLKGKSDDTVDKAVVLGPLALITAIALALDDVGIVVALTGALMGSAVIYILPMLMLLKADKVAKNPIEKKLAPLAMIALGAISGVLGVVTTFA